MIDLLISFALYLALGKAAMIVMEDAGKTRFNSREYIIGLLVWPVLMIMLAFIISFFEKNEP